MECVSASKPTDFGKKWRMEERLLEDGLFDDYDAMHPWVEVAIVVVSAGGVECE
jgi:hypothetical protein